MKSGSKTKLNDPNHMKQPGASSHATMASLVPHARLLPAKTGRHHGIICIHPNKLATPLWHSRRTPASNRSGKTLWQHLQGGKGRCRLLVDRSDMAFVVVCPPPDGAEQKAISLWRLTWLVRRLLICA